MKGIIVDGYSTGEQLAKDLLRRGCELIHVQSTKRTPAVWEKKFNPSLYSKNIIYTEKTFTDIKNYHPDFVITGSELGVTLSEQLSFKLGLYGNNPLTTNLRRNKHCMMSAVKNAGLAFIDEYIVSPKQKIPDIPKSWYPVVVKPTESAGGDGVVICASPQEVEKAIHHSFSTVNILGMFNHEMLIQKKISGQQLMINTITVNGEHDILEVWLEQRKIIDNKHTVYDYEILLNDYESLFKGVSAYVKNVLSALQIQYGPCHIELFWTNNGPILIEVAARLQGGIDGKVSEFALGYSHISAFASLIVGEYHRNIYFNHHKRKKHILLVNLIFNQEGIITTSSFDQLVLQLNSFHSSISIPKVGDYVPKTTNLASKVGHFYLVSDNTEQLMLDYQQVRYWEEKGQLFTLKSSDTRKR